MGEPVRVVATMASSILVTSGLPCLDGPLSMGVFRLMDQTARDALPDLRVADWAKDLDLPLDTWEMDVPLLPGADRRLFRSVNEDRGIIWGWRCSQAQPLGGWGSSRFNLRQRAPVDAYRDVTAAARVDLKAGRLKPHDLTYSQVTTRQFEWFAVGDPARILHALEQVTSIGKHHNLGRGEVLEWSVTPHDDPGAWRSRLMPDPAGLGTWRAVRAPYYRPERRYPCR